MATITSENPLLAVLRKSLIGLSLDTASERVANMGHKLRVVNLDGKPRMVTADYDEGRLNVWVAKGVVVKVVNFG